MRELSPLEINDRDGHRCLRRPHHARYAVAGRRNLVRLSVGRQEVERLHRPRGDIDLRLDVVRIAEHEGVSAVGRPADPLTADLGRVSWTLPSSSCCPLATSSV